MVEGFLGRHLVDGVIVSVVAFAEFADKSGRNPRLEKRTGIAPIATVEVVWAIPLLVRVAHPNKTL